MPYGRLVQADDLEDPMSVLALMSLVAVSISTGGVQTSGCEAPYSADLDRPIASFTLTEGSEGVGGAQMADVVDELRNEHCTPVHFEDLDLGLESGGLSLAEAIRRLERLEDEGTISKGDERRLEIYRQKLDTVEDPESHVVFIDFPVFRLDLEDTSLVEVLDRATELAPAYQWELSETAGVPQVVIKPRRGSVLTWPVASRCPSPSPLQGLWDEGGYLFRLFFENDLQLWGVEEGSSWSDVPTAEIDLCREDLTARKVLTLSVKAIGAGYVWTVRGRKGFRLIAFERMGEP